MLRELLNQIIDQYKSKSAKNFKSHTIHSKYDE